MKTLFFFVCIGWLTYSSWLRAADWPQFRGPDGSGVSSDLGLPVEWDQSKNMRWKVDLPGRGLSNPVISNGNVYVTACTGYKERRLHVLCFEEATGRKRWERQFQATGNTQCHVKTCMAAPTPCTDGDRVFALFATGDLACLDKDGNLVWYRSLVPDYPTITNQVGMAASPILWNDVLIVPMENVGESFVAAIDKRTGQNRWKAPRSKDINWVTPLLRERNGSAELLVTSAHELTAYDPATGAIRWKLEQPGFATIPSLAASEELLIVPSSGVTAFRPGTEGSKPEEVWKETKLRSGYASPLYYDGNVYGISSANALVCVDAKDGNVVWQQRVRGPAYSASPVAADGKVYVVNEEGTTTVIQTGPQPKVLGQNPLEDTILATPAIANGRIFLRSDRRLYCIGAEK